jgi:hypothetical protein
MWFAWLVQLNRYYECAYFSAAVSAVQIKNREMNHSIERIGTILMNMESYLEGFGNDKFALDQNACLLSPYQSIY